MRIIACDDEKLALKVMERAIKEACPDGELRCYSDPEAAIDEIKRDGFIPDVAFLDIEMPVMNGVTTAHELKAINPKLNVVFATGYTEYYQEAIELHASGYILKPVSGEHVKKAMENLIYPLKKGNGLVAQTFGNFLRGIGIGFVEENNEFFTAESCDNVVFAQGVTADFGQFYQHFIAGFVAICIVNVFEFIGIKQQQTEVFGLFDALVNVFRHQFFKIAAVPSLC